MRGFRGVEGVVAIEGFVGKNEESDWVVIGTKEKDRWGIGSVWGLKGKW